MEENKPNPPTDEELEELMETIKKLEEDQKNKKIKRPKGLLVIEFGGVYHTNPIIDFLFTFLMNVTLSLFIIEIFGLATYQSELTFIAFIAVYTVVELFVKQFLSLYFLQYIIKSFGFVLFVGYLIIFYIIDQYLFTGSLFNFNHEYFIVAFVTLFVIIRYLLGTQIKRRLRKTG